MLTRSISSKLINFLLKYAVPDVSGIRICFPLLVFIYDIFKYVKRKTKNGISQLGREQKKLQTTSRSSFLVKMSLIYSLWYLSCFSSNIWYKLHSKPFLRQSGFVVLLPGSYHFPVPPRFWYGYFFFFFFYITMKPVYCFIFECILEPRISAACPHLSLVLCLLQPKTK